MDKSDGFNLGLMRIFFKAKGAKESNWSSSTFYLGRMRRERENLNALGRAERVEQFGKEFQGE